jgi:hypothetical protein
MVCAVLVRNTGNVRLNGVQTLGDATCTLEAVLQPNAASNIACFVNKTATQDNFEAGNMSLAVTATATPSGTDSAPVTASNAVTVDLPVRRQLVLNLDRTNGSAVIDRAGTIVQLTVTATNGGNTHLRGITLAMPDLEAMVCNDGTAAITLPTDLLVGSVVTCSGSFAFSQDALEAGSRNFTAGGAAANLGGPAASNTVEVVVAASPGLQLDVDALNCTKPSRMREYRCFCCVCLLWRYTSFSVLQHYAMAHQLVLQNVFVSIAGGLGCYQPCHTKRFNADVKCLSSQL